MPLRNRCSERASRLANCGGRMLRNVERFCGPMKQRQAELIKISWRIFEQKRDDHQKLYSVHAPEV